MAVVFVDFTDNDGVSWKINPAQVISITGSKVAGKQSIVLQDGTRLLSQTKTLAEVEAIFEV